LANSPAISLRFWLSAVSILVIGLGALWGWQGVVGEQDPGAVAAAESAVETGHGLKNADGSWKYSNKLVGETSPYLLLHAHNPVDWYPWGEEGGIL
jgi:Highly conserved protein containing a thioredoxin domain